MADPILLASGRDADVFAVDDRRVLRRYRDGGDVATEVALMVYLAGQSFPVPTVYDVSGADLVMERLDGPTMLAALISGALGVSEAATCLADLHRRLHALPPRTSPPADAQILHLDLHPDNVMLTSRGPVVIDWRNAVEGPADLDIAVSAVILAQAAVDETSPLASLAAELLRAFLDRAGGNPLSVLDQAVAKRRNGPGLTAVEMQRLPAAALLIIRHARADDAQRTPHGA